jgi:hypothetical protein
MILHIANLKLLPSGIFDWEHSSRATGMTVIGLRIDEDGTLKLPCWLGLAPKGYTRDPQIVHDAADIAIALETPNGDWFWMHISDYSQEVPS